MILPLLLAGGLSACSKSPNHNTAARLVPGDAQGFVSIALNPSMKQKAELFKLSKHFPLKEQVDNKDDVRIKVIDLLLKDAGLTYDADLKSWLGAEVAVALLKPYDKDTAPLSVFFVKVKDQKKALETLEKKKVEKESYRFISGYLVAVEFSDIKHRQGDKAFEAIQQIVDRKAEPLSKKDKYKKAIDSIKDEHLAMGWIDVPSLVSQQKGDMFSDEMFRDLYKSIEEHGTFAFTLFAQDKSIVLQSVSERESQYKTVMDGNLLRRLPEGTIAAFGVGDGTKFMDQVDKITNSYSMLGLDQEVNDQLNSINKTLEGEAVALLGGMGKEKLVPNVAVVGKTKDPGAVIAALDKVDSMISSDVNIKVKKSTSGDTTHYTLTYVPGYHDLFADIEDEYEVFKGTDTLEEETLGVVSVSKDKVISSTSIEYSDKLIASLNGPAKELPFAVGNQSHIALGFLDIQGVNEFITKSGESLSGFGMGMGFEESSSPSELGGSAKAWINVLDKATVRAWNHDGNEYSEVRLSFK